MPALVKFRHRIALLVGVAAFALVIATAVSLVLSRQSEHQVADVELRYVPLLELDRDLKALFAAIPRALEDAASAGEESGLEEADRLRDQFIERLEAGRGAIASNGRDAEAVLGEFKAYYAQAREVSAALLTGEPGEGIAGRIELMRAAQARAATRLDASTRPDRARLAAAFAAARAKQRNAVAVEIAVAAVALIIMLLVSWGIVRRSTRSLRSLSLGMERLARGDFSQEITVATRDEFGEVARQSNQTALRLREYRDRSEQEAWVKTGITGLAEAIAGQVDPDTLGRVAMAYLAAYVGAEVGVVYAGNEYGTFRLLDTHGVELTPGPPRSFQLGETQLGQAARDDDVRVVTDLPPDYARIRSGLGAMPARQVVIVPFAHEGRVMGVLELGLSLPLAGARLELLRRVRGALGVAFRVAESQQWTQTLLEETRRQAEELRAAHDTLELRNQTLEASERRLQNQQDELQQTNEELAQQAEELESQRAAVVEKNDALVHAQRQLEDKAVELARTSRYKSEFLANMSHELRTPLNSIMILSQLLADDDERNLTEKQIEFASIIHKSGEELLALINDVLDLAKVEAGKQEVVVEALPLAEVADYARRMFQAVAQDKGLALDVDLMPGLPRAIRTDRAKVTQILKNLVSNAIKFTAEGRVGVRIAPAGGDRVAVRVSDTGIGIAPDKQALVFEAFAQADGGTSRTYGGTGLGLSIARQLARLLGGDLTVVSEVGVGSTFELVLPASAVSSPRLVLPPVAATSEGAGGALLDDDRERGEPDAPRLLIIEDDRAFASVVLGMIRGAGCLGLVATTGREGLALAERFHPTGILLDVGLPDMDGWAVMERLQQGPARDVPVHFLTATDDAERARRLGAVGFLAKPVGADQIRAALHQLESAGRALGAVLLVEPDDATRASIGERLVHSGLAVDAVATAREALERVRRGGVDGVVQNLALPDKQGGFDLLARLREDPASAALPVIVHTGLALTPEEMRRLEVHDRATLILQGERSPERVLEEVRAFLRRVQAAVPPPSPSAPASGEPALAGKHVLIVDDDMRNVYSLSTALRARRLEVRTAADGQEALDELAAHPDVDAVLMDVMMPRMDGHEATRRIRQDPRFHEVPIIALTAKTMPGERQRCLDAGASDYVPKPVDVDRLLSLLRVYLR